MGRSWVRRAIGVGLIVMATAALAGWISVLAAGRPAAHTFAKMGPWPVACTTRGCVTTTAWREFHRLNVLFTQAVEIDEPSDSESLTAVLRRGLVEAAQLRTPVTPADARRYREEILRFRDEALLNETLGLTLAEYDEEVILPFLQQEALKTELAVESTEELYQQLAQERWVIILPFGLKWDKKSGMVVSR